MEDFQLKLFSKISFDSLSEKEKEQLNDWCSNEEEFQSLKSLFTLVDDSKLAIGENFKTKSKLDELFEQKHQSANGFDWRSFLFPSGVIFFRQPAFQFAFGIILVLGFSLFFVNQPSVQLAKNEVQKSKKKKSKSDSGNKKSQGEQTLDTITDSQVATIVSESNVSNIGSDEMATDIVSEDNFVMLDQPAEAQMEDFDGYTSESIAEDYSLMEKDIQFAPTSIQPVSANSSVLDLLYTTY
jgi:hypothetical protein